MSETDCVTLPSSSFSVTVLRSASFPSASLTFSTTTMDSLRVWFPSGSVFRVVTVVVVFEPSALVSTLVSTSSLEPSSLSVVSVLILVMLPSSFFFSELVSVLISPSSVIEGFGSGLSPSPPGTSPMVVIS